MNECAHADFRDFSAVFQKGSGRNRTFFVFVLHIIPYQVIMFIINFLRICAPMAYACAHLKEQL